MRQIEFRAAAWVAVLALAGAAHAADLTADQIVEKNVAARGGLDAWRKIDTMVWIGHLEGEHAPAPSVPFVMQQKRPNKTRFEVRAMNQPTLRVFDGVHGWRANFGKADGPDVKPYTQQEVTFAFRSSGFEGPLIDYRAKGSEISLEGMDQIDGHKAYHLKVKLASGEVDDVWVDAITFLETRYDRPSYGPNGSPSTVSIFLRDYRPIDQVQIPAVIETTARSGESRDKMIIDRFMLNTPLGEQAFAKPGGGRSNGVAMSTRSRRPAISDDFRPSTPAAAPAAQGRTPPPQGSTQN